MKDFREFSLISGYDSTEGKTMKCEDFQIQISKLLDDEFHGKSSGELFGHLRSCPECSMFYERTKQIDKDLKAVSLALPDSALAKRIQEKIKQKTGRTQKTQSVPVFWRRIPVYALVALLAVGVGNVAGKTLTQALLNQNSETTLDLMIPDGNVYISDIFSDISQGEQAR